MSAVLPNPAFGPPTSATMTGSNVAPDAVVDPLTPAQRLARSREQIRESIVEVAPPPRHAVHVGDPGAASSALQSLLDKAMSVPALNVIVDAAQSWWRYHPWRAVGAVAADAGRLAVTPVANRHPVLLVLGAALAGAVLLRWGPWKWVAKRTVVAGFVPRLVTRVAATLPLESWLSAFAFLRGKPESTSKPQPLV